MFNDYVITLNGGFAIVTIMMWISFILYVLYYIYQTRLFKPLRKLKDSLVVLIKPRKQRYQYSSLYNAGYIYKWSFDRCIKKWDKGL
jgi:hypothetical protein